jgi:hypothetical protein
MRKNTIEVLNAIGANVWAMVCILAGTLLCAGCLCYGKSVEPGTLLIGGGLTLLQRAPGA